MELKDNKKKTTKFTGGIVIDRKPIKKPMRKNLYENRKTIPIDYSLPKRYYDRKNKTLTKLKQSKVNKNLEKKHNDLLEMLLKKL